MKKLFIAILTFISFSLATHAQTTAPAQTKPATAQTSKKATAAANTAHVKKDGTPDKRYKENKHVKKDGTPDKRYKENKK
ncbi:hypothetical protein A8C56_11240 [Niabella ginsenosidivorans]|uniref:Uncharacterized protein n=1 Tax=Niabella ginsenosidivorans TaxID=1176587 RepID=A0A1A9I344_9BACT|nr:hypothetical protein [Niabella ginsenosidivorans]ANH81479.1 hypothetical protein A8C56_11240 [Niabella ginsenosidivorans]